jgi:hypothetical protein
MCNHSQVTNFDGQEYCNLCNEELDQLTGKSVKQQEIEDNDIDYQMDDSSSEDDRDMNDMLEDHENSECDRMSEGY